MFMIMNYNKWFYDQHKYRTGSRNNVEGYVDTKWYTINERFKNLVDVHSQLITEQPFMVYGNKYGFDELIDLMSRSNYTFEDLDAALSDTYRVSLQNAMSRNVVNTHAVIFHCNNLSKDNVTSESFSHYRIIDVPFYQMHFGGRDEFIRQKIHDMHTTENDKYIRIENFNVLYGKILDFSLICAVNGYISNDCYVAIDDKGFKFKIGWPWEYDVEFIIYKLDHSTSYNVSVTRDTVLKTSIPYETLGINKNDVKGQKCLINIHDPRFNKGIVTVPNFGIFDNDGLSIMNLQQNTVAMLDKNKPTEVTMSIHCLKYFHEVPNIYPAVNYYDILDHRLVYDEKYESIVTPGGNKVVASSTINTNYLTTCTPPIVLDRDVTYSFTVLMQCVRMRDSLMEYEQLFKDTGKAIMLNDAAKFFYELLPGLKTIYPIMCNLYNEYQQGAILTSIISNNCLNTFKMLNNNLERLINTPMNDAIAMQRNSFDELYEDNYKLTVDRITAPFINNKSTSVFADMAYVFPNFFDVSNSDKRFNRPVSEQSFIALRYDHDAGCWLFAAPEIKHFTGIGNTFYVDTELTGNELFKFFVLYTDTEAPATEMIPTFTQETVFDYDKFVDEVRKYIGCIRYWDAENRLLKMSHVLYNEYSGETCTYVLSKILKRKVEGASILRDYPSDMNYEESNGTSDSIHDYSATSERGPFIINFAFYTLSLLNGNEDRLQAYFYNTLTNQKFDDRYNDIDIRSIINVTEGFPINYSQYSIAPSSIGNDTVLHLGGYTVFYGLPLMLDTNGELPDDWIPYPYTFNVYIEKEAIKDENGNDTGETRNKSITLPSISDNGLDPEYYTHYIDPETRGSSIVNYADTFKVGKLFTEYLDIVYDGVSRIQTNYKSSYNVSSIIESMLASMNVVIGKISDIIEAGSITDEDVLNAANIVINYNAFINTNLNNLVSYINQVNKISYDGRDVAFIQFINQYLLGTLKNTYINKGFANNGYERINELYNHLKKINEPMNEYLFSKWLSDIDVDFISKLDSSLAADPARASQDPSARSIFVSIAWALREYINPTLTTLGDMKSEVDNLRGNFETNQAQHINTAITKILTDYKFDMYAIRNIEYDTSTEYAEKPDYVIIEIPDDAHTKQPTDASEVSDEPYSLILQPITDCFNDAYTIRSLANVCEYTFFDGEPLGGLTMKVIKADGTVLGSQQIVINFVKVSSTAEEVNTFNMIPNMLTTNIEFENGHESFDIVNGLIVNEKHADMNYELLSGNRFIPLDHEIEFVLEPVTWLQGSIDRLHIENQWMNRMITESYSHDSSVRMFFKPNQVVHLAPDISGAMDSVYGKYFEGQTIYIKTNDNHTIFPAKITAVDHSINKGFIEADVDSWNANWFELTDLTEIGNYLTTSIECEVVDDNIRNFLDEFSDGNLGTFFNPGPPDNPVYDTKIPDCYSLPGDPIYVSENADYVYTRLKWMFSELVPNRFIDEDHKTHRFIYLTSGFVLGADDKLKINMINHNFDTMTLPTKYPILRDEPDDHKIWDLEIEKFTTEIAKAEGELHDNLEPQLENLYEQLSEETTIYGRDIIIGEIESVKCKIDSKKEFIERLTRYRRQLEKPTTWFNLVSYDAALVYIANGRADKFSPAIIDNIRDAIYADDIDVFLYDWEHKQWLDPSTYTVEKEIVDGLKIDECDEYKTNSVLCSITIQPGLTFVQSKQILVYLSYNKSDVFDSVDMNSKDCVVNFKPLLTMDKPVTDYEPYADIRIRKHFDGYEKYKVSGDDIHIKRVKRSGKYIYAPTFRVCDIKISDGTNDYDFNAIKEFFVKAPFQDIRSYEPFMTQNFYATINADIDSFTPGHTVKLIAISNNEKSNYDGNISTVMFEGTLALNNGKQSITITKSSLPNYITGKFVCTVFQDAAYDDVGGVISVNVSKNASLAYDEWFKVPAQYMKYREVPDEFKLTLNNPINGDVFITLENHYVRDVNDTITEDNSNLYNPYEYYYNDSINVRLPISDVRINDNNTRLVVDTTENTDVKLIKTPYIGICRYSLGVIPEDGLIDMTGYLPTPLTRDRYEFWVNGRYLNDTDKLVILSPTSVQLKNLTSLKNFEVVELVDDTYRNDVIREGNLYVDVNGNTYSSYRLALLANTKIRNQGIKFTFNANVHEKIHDYTKNIIGNPNNRDIEEDILNSVTFDDSNMDYNKLMNIPKFNGVSLFHPKLQDLGISEIPEEKIIEKFDEVWKIEAVTNPLFMMTHRDTSIGGNIRNLVLHMKEITDSEWNGIEIDDTNSILIYATGPMDKYFSLYLSNLEDGEIDDVDNTVKIIPFVTAGVYILIDKKYKGLWLHSTYEGSTPIHLV